MSMELARKQAIQAWRKPKTSHIIMIPELAEEFAIILYDVGSKPWLGNATTRELIDELRARHEIDGTLDYKTVGEF